MSRSERLRGFAPSFGSRLPPEQPRNSPRQISKEDAEFVSWSLEATQPEMR